MTIEENQPDWDKIAQKFDLWLPHIKPVGDALLEKLNAQQGDAILDVASGTGEPALTLARKMGNNIKITGFDAAAGMTKVAQGKVVVEKLSNIHFETMPVEQLTYGDNLFDKILCRFGVMLFNDPLAGAKEMCRVLKPGGSFSLAVWSNAKTMPTLYWAYEVLKNKVPEDACPPLKKITSMGEPGVIEALLKDAGFSHVQVESKTFYYQFKTFDEYWDIVEASDIMKISFDALSEEQQRGVRDEVAEYAEEYISEDGFRVPHDFLLVSGEK